MGKKNKYKNPEGAARESSKQQQPAQAASATQEQQQQQQAKTQQQPKSVSSGQHSGGDGPQRLQKDANPQKEEQSRPSQQRSASQQQQGKLGEKHRQQQQMSGPSQEQQKVGTPQQQQRGPPQQQQRGPPQQQQRGPPQQQQRGPPQQQQRGPPQQWGPPQQQQRGPPQQQQRGPPQNQQRQQTWGHSQPQSQQQQKQSTGAVPKSSSVQQQSFTQVKSGALQSFNTPVSSISGIDRGTLGIRGIVEANYLRLNLDNMPDVAYHYDITITPDRPKKHMRPAVEQFNRLFFQDIPMAFDGMKNVYTIEKLPKTPFEAKVKISESATRTVEYQVLIKETDTVEVDLSSLRNYAKERIFDKPMRALQCIEVVLANPCHNSSVRVGRSFYRNPDRKYDLKDGYEMWLGLYQAAILGDEPFLNVDIAHKSFPIACHLLHYMTTYLRNVDFNVSLDKYQLNDLRAFLKGINIVYDPPKSFNSTSKTYRVNDVSDLSAEAISFTTDDGKKQTVAQYFKSKGYKLKYPKLNCLHVGSRVKNNFVPLELCSIAAGQALNKKDGSRQVQQMIHYSATSTNERKDKIMEMLRNFHHNDDNLVNAFGIRIGANFIDVPIRMLSSPTMEYCNGVLINPEKGAWRLPNTIKFLNTTQLKSGPHKWALIYSKKSHIKYGEFANLASMFKKKALSLNMNLANDPNIEAFDNIDSTLRWYKGENYDLVIVVLPVYGTTYADIKQSAELRHGVLTQCIKEQTIQRRCNDQLILNVLLKVNAKLNGTNHKISDKTHVLLKNVMYLGADVTHPSPDQREIPSVVGVAASHDIHGACYNMQYRLQQSTKEDIEDMNSIVTNHLKVYLQHQGKYPDHIIYYRDGVSDGQFPIIKKIELSAIRAACQKLQISPKIACIIVVKRHHTRFFPKPSQRPMDKFNNVVPGTVVDQIIVHPNEVQFFMVSHQSIQGTAKPTRYNVIQNDDKLNIDLLQKLTYNLCHMFPRCNRSVSYPAPAYLAHLVAFRGRVYVEGQQRFAELQREYEKRLVRPDLMQRNPMYFV